MKPNNIKYTLSKRQLECLVLVSLTERRHRLPNFRDLQDTIARTDTQDIYDAFKLSSAVQTLRRAGLIDVRDLPNNIIPVFPNGGVCQKSYHVSERGKERLTNYILNRAY